MTTEKKYTLYKHTTPDGKIYIGSTSQKPRERWRGGSGYSTNKRFFRAIQKYGWGNIKHDIIADDLTEREAQIAEIVFIHIYESDSPKKGYNKSVSGVGFMGCHHTEDAKKKMRTNRRKIKPSAVYVTRLDRGRRKVYNSVSEAAAENGVDVSNISKACYGKRKTAGGYRWERGDGKC